jgi:hypothetical protein
MSLMSLNQNLENFVCFPNSCREPHLVTTEGEKKKKKSGENELADKKNSNTNFLFGDPGK